MTSNTRTKALLAGMAMAAATAIAVPNAMAHVSTTTQSVVSDPVEPLPRATVFADNVVVSPGTAQAPAQPSPTVVVPQAAQPAAQPAPVVEQSTRHKEVRADVSSSHNYVSTIALSALMGGLAGGLIGGAIHYLANQSTWRNVGYWAAGGVLVGAGIGVVQLVVQEDRVSDAVAVSHLPTDPAPTYRLALMHVSF